jgi:hypothetical protein
MSEYPRDITREQEETYYDHCVEIMEDRGIAEYEFKQKDLDQTLQAILDDVKNMRIVSVESNAFDYGEYDIEQDECGLPAGGLGEWVENIVVNTKMIIERPSDGQQYTLDFDSDNKPNALRYDYSIAAGTIGEYVNEKLSKFEDTHQPYIDQQLMKAPEMVVDNFFSEAETSHNKCVLKHLLKEADLTGDEILIDRETSRAQTTIGWAVELLSENKTEKDCVDAINQLDEITSKVKSGEISINEQSVAEENLSVSISM